MNPVSLFSLSAREKQQYLAQPDNIPDFHAQYHGTFECASYMPDTSVRFWYNIQNVSYSSHWHNFTELILPLEETYCADVDTVHYDLVPGDILLIPAGALHSLHAPEHGSRFIFLFDLEPLRALPGFSGVLSRFCQPVFLSADTHPALYEKECSLLMEAARQYWGKSPARELRIYACLLEFLSNYADSIFPEEPCPCAPPSTNGKSALMHRLSLVFDHVEQNYMNPISLEEAASVAGFSKYYFARLFKEYMTQTFYDYLTARRIRAAELLLAAPGLPVTQIALQTGFGCLSSFNRTFRKIKGCTPTEYRNSAEYHIQS